MEAIQSLYQSRGIDLIATHEGKRFKNRNCVNLHTKIAEFFVCRNKICGGIFVPTSESMRVGQGIEASFVCSVCGKIYHYCLVCLKSYKQKRYLSKHRLLSCLHSVEKPICLQIVDEPTGPSEYTVHHLEKGSVNDARKSESITTDETDHMGADIDSFSDEPICLQIVDEPTGPSEYTVHNNHKGSVDAARKSESITTEETDHRGTGIDSFPVEPNKSHHNEAAGSSGDESSVVSVAIDDSGVENPTATSKETENAANIQNPIEDPDIDCCFSVPIKKMVERLKIIDRVAEKIKNDDTLRLNDDDIELMRLRHVVAKSVGMSSVFECARVSPMDAARHLLYASFLQNLTGKQREELFLVQQLDSLVKQEYEDDQKSNQPKGYVPTELPKSQAEARSQYFESVNSISKNLNMFDVTSDGNSAKGKVIDFVHSLMLREGPSNEIWKTVGGLVTERVKNAVDCERARELIKEMYDSAAEKGIPHEKVVPLLVAFFDDGFDPSQQNNGFGGLNLCTLSGLNFEDGNIGRMRSYTDVILLSRTTDDHDRILAGIMEELRCMREPFKTYHKTKGSCYAIVRLFNANRDRVQRDKVTALNAHNGSKTGQFGSVLPTNGPERSSYFSCNTCIRLNIESTFDQSLIGGTRACTDCLDFETAPKRNFHLMTPLHEDYPPGVANLNSPSPPVDLPIHHEKRLLNSFRQSMAIMRQAVRVSLYNVVSDNGWYLKQYHQYLHDAGINGHVQSKGKKMYYALEHLPEHERIKALDEYGYEEVMPLVWKYDDILDIDDNLDPIMHLVFEGVEKVMMNEVITSTIEVMGLKDECLPQIQIALIELQQLSIEWMLPERLTKKKGKTVGWKGTDYLASARVMKILISHVKEAIEEEGGDNLEKNLEGYRILEQFVSLAHSMISRIMCDSCTEGDILELELHIKLFLCWSQKYCLEFQKKKVNKTFTATKGNFLSLMNLPRQMRKFGPMRRYWDGDYEKFISYVKEILPGGINREGAATLVAKLRRFKETVAVNASKEEAMDYLKKKGGSGQQKGLYSLQRSSCI